MYVAVKGGEQAIKSAHQLLAEYRRGDAAVAEISVTQIKQQMPLTLARVMTEGFGLAVAAVLCLYVAMG